MSSFHFWFFLASLVFVFNHNANRHDGHTGAGMSLEAIWTSTTRWDILGTSEVNAYQCRAYFGSAEHETQFKFHQNLAQELLLYEEQGRGIEATPRRTRTSQSFHQHELCKVLPFSRNFWQGSEEKLTCSKSIINN